MHSWDRFIKQRFHRNLFLVWIERAASPHGIFICKHLPQEINYEIYDKELLAIIKFFEKTRVILEEAGLPVKIFTNNRSL